MDPLLSPNDDSQPKQFEHIQQNILKVANTIFTSAHGFHLYLSRSFLLLRPTYEFHVSVSRDNAQHTGKHIAGLRIASSTWELL